MPSTLPWWKSYLQSHPLLSAVVGFTTLGGMILLTYFVHLGVMPDLDWTGTNALLLYTAIIALMLFGYMALFTVGAGWFTRVQGPEVEDLRTSWLGPILLLLPSIAFAYRLIDNEMPEKSYALEALLAAVFLIGIGYANLNLQTKQLRCIKFQEKFYLFANYLMLSLAWFLNLMIAALVFTKMSERAINDLWLYIWLLLCTSMNLMVLRIKKLTLSFIAFGAIAGLLMLVALTGNGMAIPRAVVRSLGMGDLPVSLLVTESGCNQINQLSGQKVCQSDSVTKTALVCPALLRSRIGSPYFVGLLTQREIDHWPLAYSANSTSATSSVVPGPWQIIALRPSEVLGWSRIQLMRSVSVSESPPSATIVSYLDATTDQIWIQKQCGSNRSSNYSK